ncbi:MAG: homoserine kinase [Metallosphaera sp.]
MSMRVRAIAFSSSANLGAGYDVLSMSHRAFNDVVYAELLDSGEGRIFIETDSSVPTDPSKNSASVPVEAIMEDYRIKGIIKLKIVKGIPPGLGLGSSGASAVAAVAAVSRLLDLNLSLEDIVKYAVLGEKAVSGSPHPDNVAASAFGGVVAVTSHDPFRIVRVAVNYDFKIMLIIPRLATGVGKTKRARELVPPKVELNKVVENARYLSSLMVGLIKGDRNLIQEGMNDSIVEKAREPLYPYYPKIREISLKYNSVGVCVSGAGPSVLVLYDEETELEKIKLGATDVCRGFGFDCDFVTTEIGGGVKVEGLD